MPLYYNILVYLPAYVLVLLFRTYIGIIIYPVVGYNLLVLLYASLIAYASGHALAYYITYELSPISGILIMKPKFSTLIN